MNRIADTSREAFADLGQRKVTMADRIVARMRTRIAPWTRSELVEEMGIKGTTLTARIRELLDAERVMEVGRKECPITGRNVHALSVA